MGKLIAAVYWLSMDRTAFDPLKHESPLFPIADGKLLVGEIPVDKLAEQLGSTPFFAYDKNLIRQRVESLRSAIPPKIKLYYAVKANPFPPVIEYLNTLVDGFDVASCGELKLALAAGAMQVSFAGPGKRKEELALAIAAGVLINVESSRELREIAAICNATGTTPRLAVRINPDFELKMAGMKMGGGAKPFGVDAEVVPQMLAEIDAYGLRCEGFHVYAGSQNLKADAVAHAFRESYLLACRLAKFARTPPESLNLGGGLGIPYFPGEKRLDLGPLGEALDVIYRDSIVRFPNCGITVELGRYLVGEAGIYVTRIIDKKCSRGQTFLVTDGGMNHHLAASGNFGQVIRKNYPVALASQCDCIGQGEPVNIVGPLCTPLDVLADKVKIGVPEIGQLVIVFQSGAYGASASPHGLLSYPPPHEVLV